ncbi:MAG: class I SAM-dependent methyltransferase [Pseudomonadota bacterium]|nr:class I SAM-dependent methyltransferase [Pseudomonadota bacterium]
MTALPDPGSFRDPGGRVYAVPGRIFRSVMPCSAPAYESVRDSGLLDALTAQRLVVDSRECDPSVVGKLFPDPAYMLEHPPIPFISYPYEWSFSLLKKAALHHLDVQLAALDKGFTLSDATAYNIQFVGPQPTFIDHLSFRPYRDGEIWMGHRQFCMQFLNPLIMWSRLGLAPNPWFRGGLEGIAPEELAPLLSWRHNLSLTILTHVTAQASLQRRSVQAGAQAGRHREAKLPLASFRNMLGGLRSFVEGCSLPKSRTVWSDYADNNSYAEPEARAKRAFVSAMAQSVRPRLMFDLGCNTGDYASAALAAGAGHVIGFDFDYGALEQAVARAEGGKLNFLPLWLDAANPSPAQGWGQAERKGLKERADADALVALAFIHHIVIGRNIPLEMAVDWIVAMAPHGVIEFPPKTDPMVRQLLAQREDIFPDYHEQAFRAAVSKRARIVAEEHLAEGGRLLVRYDRS